jgi:cytochrome b
MSRQTKIRIWDPLVRLFHWSLVAGFATAYLSQEDYLALHSWAGYLVAALVWWRIVWGFVGEDYARFADFVRSPAEAWRYLRDTLRRRARRYLGHNPAGGAMVVLLLSCLLLTAISGMAVYGIGDHAGPLALLAQVGTDAGFVWQDHLENIHEFLAHFTLMLIAVHVTGVVVESVLHRENLVRAMIDGRKRVENIDLPQESSS